VSATQEIPLPIRDPFGKGPLVVTRLESPATGVTIEGRFTLGWVGRLTREQLDFVGILLARRNNLQQLATDLGLSYNTVRARFDDIVEALDGVAAPAPRTPPRERPRPTDKVDLLRRLAAGEIDPDEAEAALRGGG
jgi:hypothetical protein